MKRNASTSIFTNNSIKTRIVAILFALILLCLTGCKSDSSEASSNGSSQNGSANSSDTASDGNTSSSTEAEDSNAADTSATTETSTIKEPVVTSSTITVTSSNKVDAADGELSVEEGVKYTSVASDDDEYELVVNPAGLAYGYEGYASKEADALRKEILNTGNTEEYYTITGTKYYISAKGNDNNNGLSPKTPLKTINAIEAYDLKPGDAVLFERGSIFRLLEQYNPAPGVIYGSYGKGRKPIILGSPENFANCVWKPSNKKNVWYTSYLYAYPAGAFFDQGKEIGYMKYNLRTLTKNTDFWCDTDSARLYVYCDKGNPADVWDSIELSQTGCHFKILSGVSNVTFDNICMRYTDSGVGANYNNHFIKGTNLELGFTGGLQFASGNRAGNAFAQWYGGNAFTVNHSWIYQTFDSAVSPQGNGGPNLKYDNMSVCNNLFEYNNADIEFWDHGFSESGPNGITTTYTRFKNFKMDGNICRFTALGWGTRADDGGIRGIEGVIYAMAEGNDIINVTFTNNIVDCPGRKIFDFPFNTVEQANGFTARNNTIYIKNSLRTTDQIIRGITLPFDGVMSHFGSRKQDVIDILHKFDSTAKIYWYE